MIIYWWRKLRLLLLTAINVVHKLEENRDNVGEVKPT